MLRQTGRSCSGACLAFLLLLSWTFALMAHDLQTRVEISPPYVVLTAQYEGIEAASFIAVTVHPPPSAGIKADAYQTGHTDYNGRFVFIPSAPGLWRVVLDDELGHRTELTADIGGDASVTGGGTASGRSATEKLVVGLSVLFGAAGLLYGWLSRRREAGPA